MSIRTLNQNKVQQNRIKYVYFYAILISIVLLLVFQRALTLFYFCLKASRRIHDKLFNGIIRAKMYFFNTNSSGRIINRFSKDIHDIDFLLPTVLYDTLLVMCFFFLFLQIFYMKCHIIGNSIKHQKRITDTIFFSQFFFCTTVFPSIRCHHDIDIDIKLLAIDSDHFNKFFILWNSTHLHKYGQMLKTDRIAWLVTFH